MDRSIDNPRIISASPRSLALAAAATLTLLVAGWLTGVLDPSRPGSSAVAPAAASASALERIGPAGTLPISQAIGLADPAYRAQGSAGTISLATPSQALTSHFTGAGLALASGGLNLGLNLTAAGSAGSQGSVEHASPVASGNRVLYSRGGVQEWYVNGPAGLEQGFTVASAPAGTGPLTLSLALSGNARPVLSAGGSSVSFTAPSGSSVRYGSLLATDALGRRLASHLALVGGSLHIVVDSRGASFPVKIDPLFQNGSGISEGTEGLFGFSVALSGDGQTALVGAPRMNGFAGAAWVFTLTGSTWTEQAELSGAAEGEAAPEACAASAEECSFGRSVAISNDGNTAVVGAPRNNGNHGAALVYTREGSSWSETAMLTGKAEQPGEEEELGEGRLGKSVAISPDASTIIAGASTDLAGHGSAWVFARSGASWKHDGPRLSPPVGESGEGHFGYSVAIAGNTAVVGEPTDEVAGSAPGAAWVFTRSPSGWAQPGQKLTGPTASGAHFGYSVALAGSTILIGAPGDSAGVGSAWLFSESSGVFNPVAGSPLTGGNEESGEGEFGTAVAIAGNESAAIVGAARDASHHGAAWLYSNTGSGFSKVGGKLEGVGEAGKGWFGSSAALSADGTSALIGGSHDNTSTGSVWSFASEPTGVPFVAGIHPRSGPAHGGTAVTITGSGFIAGATVTIAGAATGVEVISPSEIRAVTSGGPAGTYQVTVSDANGTSSGGATFTYIGSGAKEGGAPAVSSIEPASGPSAGGTHVTIHGTGFLASSAVLIGNLATSVQFISSTELQATTSATTAGTYEVIVSDADGTSAHGPQFTYTAPVVPQIAQAGVLGANEGQLPPPVFAVSSNIKRLTGAIYVKLPGSNKYVLLSPQMHIPFGTIIDARNGKVQVTTIGPNGKPQTIIFYAGIFKLTQSKNGIVYATLVGGSYKNCPIVKKASTTADAAASHKHVVRKLWAEGHGKYTTKGSYATGAVLGTRWLTEDLCEGTLIKVATDKVAVTNLRTHHRVIVRAGHSILIKAH